MSSIVIAGDTSGSVTLQAPAVSGSSVLTLPAVTDTVAGIAATQTLTNKSIVATQLTGTIAGARLPAGSVLQVVQGTVTNSSTTSNTFVTTGLAATITPSSASNKILVIVTLVQFAVSSQNYNGTSTIYRGATNIAPTGTGLHKSFGTLYSATGGAIAGNQTYSYLDSPSTTSATTYTIYFAVDSGGTATLGVNSNTSYIQLLEIAA